MEKSSLLKQWKDKSKSDAPSKIIKKAPEGAVIPLSYSQQRLWFLQQLYPGNPFYNYSEVYRFKGDLQVDFLVDALNIVFGNHDILRAVYEVGDGLPFMKIAPEAAISVTQHDLRTSEEDVEIAVNRILDADANHSFHLSEPPIALLSIVRTKADEYQAMLTLHHIATDKWSMNLLRSEWAGYYRTLCEGTTPVIKTPEVQYPDFAYWQRNRIVKQEQIDFWKRKLSGNVPVIDLPTDYPRPKQSGFAGRSSEFRRFSLKTSKAILSNCRQWGVTPYVFFLSIYYLLLYRYTGQKNILIGSPISDRDRKSLEDTIGFFNETIVLRTEIPVEKTFLDLLAAVKNSTLEAFSNKGVPFELLVRELQQERSLSVNPFFQVMFLYYTVSAPDSFGDGLQVDYEFYNPGVSKFDLTFDVAEENGALSFAFEYSTELFRPETIERFLDHIALLVEGAVAAPERLLSEFQMLTEREKEMVLPKSNIPLDLDIPSNPNLPSDIFKSFTGIHQPIEHMAILTPDAIAVTFGESSMTYAELNAKAHSLAVRILEKSGVSGQKSAKIPEGTDTLIGLCVERSLDMMVGLLAILKAGFAYVPIDPKYPISRVDHMLEDAEIKLLITQKKLAPLFKRTQAGQLLIDEVPLSNENPLSGNPLKRSSFLENFELPIPKKDDLAYVIYTSGSTGRPKGVPITHGNILNSTAGRLDFYPGNPKAFLLMSSISFDSSKAGIFWTLCTGGNLVITEDRIEQDLVALGDTIQRNKVNHMLLLPTLYQLVLEHADIIKLKSLSTVMVAGEACPPSLGETHYSRLPETGLYNEYGPTEATVWCIAHKIGPAEINGRVPLGKPVANARIYLLDAAMNPVPLGASGEIYVGGAGLSKGYLNRPDLTEKAFVQNPLDSASSNGQKDGSSKMDAMLYKTGDLARFNAEGNIEFLGRTDQQIKIRGYRVELGEIEKAIRLSMANVEQVVVMAEGGKNVPNRIAAYLVSDVSVPVVELKASLKKTLPDYMVPATLVQIEAMPLLPNGKIDKGALKGLNGVGELQEPKEKQASSNETERDLLSLWQEVLRIEDIGVHDNFFELGGDSILSIQLIAKARKAGINLTPNQIFDNQTIALLSGYISSRSSSIEEWDYLVALRKEGSAKPLFCIHAGGGHVFFYNILTKYIGAHRPIYALQASGVYAGKEMHNSIQAMAKDYLQAIRAVQPNGPYNIMVYCFSVAVGNEMAIQLRSAGQSANLIIMDTMTDPWKLDTGDRLRMRIKSFGKRLTSNPLQTLKGMVSERIIQLQLKLRKTMSQGDDKALALLNDNLAQICEVYQWRPHQEKVTLLLTEKLDGDINKEVIGSWKKVALGGVEVIPIEGNHIDLFAEPEVGIVAENIEKVCV